MTQGIIGIVGGVGPYAGLDVAKKIFDNTIAARDQEHLPVVLASFPNQIPDRTEFLLGHAKVNPARAVVRIIRTLVETAGVTAIGIPCNTMHAPRIFDPIKKGAARLGRTVRLVHMIEETARHIRRAYPHIKKIGVLSTTGTLRSRVYPMIWNPLGFEVLSPDATTQETCVQPAIYDAVRGIKAHANPVTRWARQKIMRRSCASAGSVTHAGCSLPIICCIMILIFSAIKSPSSLFINEAR